MEGSDEDEDVMFEHSPLHESLKEAGLTDVDVQVQKDSSRRYGPTNHTQVPHPRWRVSLHSVWGVLSLHSVWGVLSLHRVWGVVMPILGFPVLSVQLHKMTSYYKAEVLRLILQFNLLTDEDRDFLSTTVIQSNQDISRPTLRPKFFVIVTLPCVLAYIYGRVAYSDVPWRGLMDVMVALCYMVAVVTSYLVLYWRQCCLVRATQHIGQLVTDCEGLVRSANKSLRLVQEAELVARGFTLVNQQSAVWRLEQNSPHSSQRQCPRLRSSLFLVTRNCMLLIREKTMDLINRLPVGEEVDGALHYLAQLPLEEYGPCVREDGAQLYTITDGFSVASLKGIKHLCELHISELLRRLAITLCYPGVESLESAELDSLLTSITGPIAVETQTLQKTYLSHSCLIEGGGSHTPLYSPPTDPHPLRDTYMAVHSLDLHLQAAWLRVKSLSTLLKNILDQTSEGRTDQTGEGRTDQTAKEYEQLQRQVKQELYACKACCEECISRLDKVKDSHPASRTFVETPMVPPQAPPPAPLVPLFDMADPVIEDQVFEAYVTEDPIESHSHDWDEFATCKANRHKQEAVRLLMELKSVISIRATEREIRENKALEKSKLLTDGTQVNNGAVKSLGETTGDISLGDSQGQLTMKTNNVLQNEVDLTCLKCDMERQSYEDSTSRDRGDNCHTDCNQSNKDIQRTTHNSVSCVQGNNFDRKESDSFVCNVDKSDMTECDEESRDEEPVPNQGKAKLPEYTQSEDETWCDMVKSDRLPNKSRASAMCENVPDCCHGACSDNQGTIEDTLSAANMAFSASLATLAVARSRDLGRLSETTFGDEDVEDEDN